MSILINLVNNFIILSSTLGLVFISHPHVPLEQLRSLMTSVQVLEEESSKFNLAYRYVIN